MKRETKSAGKILDEFFARALKPSEEQTDLSRRNILRRLSAEPHSPLVANDSDPVSVVRKPSWRFRFVLAAAAVVIVLVGTMVLFRSNRGPAPIAAAEASDGTRYRFGDTVYSNAGLFLKLADGSRIEMRSQAQLSLESADDGMRIRLNSGSVIVSAAKQRAGHLYVQTKDVIVSVVGTVFLVNAEENGSRVAVIQGEVRVRQGAVEKKLRPGEQVATSPLMESVPMIKELSWSQNAPAHLALLQQSLALLQPPAIAPVSPPQEPGIPKWEAVSVKPCNEESRPPGVRGAGPRLSPGRLTLECMNVEQMITMSYIQNGERLLNSSFLIGPVNLAIKGGPAWAHTDKYMIEAKAEDTPDKNVMMGPMTRAILEDRFQLRTHREIEEVPMYAITVAKGGLKMQPVDLNDCRKFHGERTTPMEAMAAIRAGEKPLCGTVMGDVHGPNIVWYFGGQTLEGFANILSNQLDRHVLDKTGIQGNFAIYLEYMRDENTRNFQNLSPVEGTDIQPGPSIITAVEELGLKLEPTKGPRQYIVIDHVERPTEN